MLYAISAIVQRECDGWMRPVSLPTFYLDANVQGIVSEAHAIEIVRDMLQRLGHSRRDINVQACATNRPIFESPLYPDYNPDRDVPCAFGPRERGLDYPVPAGPGADKWELK